MNKKFLIIFIIFVAIFNIAAFGKPKKLSCKKPIYFFEEARKDKMFSVIDETLQNKGYEVNKFYQDFAFVTVNYKVLNKQQEVPILLKQFGEDVYLFIDIKQGNTKLEQDIYAALKKETKNSYMLRDNIFCRDLTKDAESISTRKKSTINEQQPRPGVYVISMKRYVGYDKKTYFLERLKEKMKKTNKLKQKL